MLTSPQQSTREDGGTLNPARSGGLFGRIARLASRFAQLALRVVSMGQVFAWADQAVVSAVAFVVVVLLGRHTGPAELGIYAIVWSAANVVLVLQDAFITRPYTLALYREDVPPRERAGGALSATIASAAISSLVLSVVALLIWLSAENPTLVSAFLVLSLAMPALLLKEFARRHAFANLRLINALVLDAGVAVLSLVILGALAVTGRLSADAAVASLGVAAAIGAVGWLIVRRGELALSAAAFRHALAEGWKTGKWLCTTAMAQQVQGYAVHWLTLAIAGAGAVGLYTACLSIVGLANPLLFGCLNYFNPKAVQVLHMQGTAGLRRQTLLNALLLGGFMLAFYAGVVMWGSTLLSLLFAHTAYADVANIMAILTLAGAASAVGAPAAVALNAMQRTREVAVVTVASAILTGFVAWWSLLMWGLVGACYGLLVVETIASTARWLCFILLSREDSTSRTAKPGGLEPTATHWARPVAALAKTASPLAPPATSGSR